MGLLVVVGRNTNEFETRTASEPGRSGWLRRMLDALLRLSPRR